MSSTAIVVGATGLVGSELVDCLAAAEHITSIVTITRRAMAHSSDKVRNHVVDFERLSDHADLLNGDMLFSCLGTTLKQAKTIDAQRKVDLWYQYESAQLAANNGVAHYLLVSSSGASAKSVSPYLRMKGELEDKVQRLAFPHISIFQPSLLVGDRNQPRLGEAVAAMLMPTLCKLPGLRRYRPISGCEVARKMVSQSIAPSEKFSLFTLDEVFL